MANYESRAREWARKKIDRFKETDACIVLHLVWMALTLVGVLYVLFCPTRFLSMPFLRFICVYLALFALPVIALRTKALYDPPKPRVVSIDSDYATRCPTCSTTRV